MSGIEHRSDNDRVREYRAAEALARGRDSKSMHRYLSLRVFWKERGKGTSAVLCREHRDSLYRQHPDYVGLIRVVPCGRLRAMHSGRGQQRLD
jgi:hypothetical protein